MGKREDTREKILIAGAAVMYRSGYNGTSVKDIVDAAEVPKGSFYNYYRSKEDFALAALDLVAERNYRQFLEVLAQESLPPLALLVRVFEVMGDYFADEYNFSKGCIIGNLCQEMADHNERIRARADHLLDRFQGVVRGCLVEAKDRGDLSPNVDVDELAEFIINAWEGTLIRMKARKSMVPFTVFRNVLNRCLLG